MHHANKLFMLFLITYSSLTAPNNLFKAAAGFCIGFAAITAIGKIRENKTTAETIENFDTLTRGYTFTNPIENAEIVGVQIVKEIGTPRRSLTDHQKAVAGYVAKHPQPMIRLLLLQRNNGKAEKGILYVYPAHTPEMTLAHLPLPIQTNAEELAFLDTITKQETQRPDKSWHVSKFRYFTEPISDKEKRNDIWGGRPQVRPITRATCSASAGTYTADLIKGENGSYQSVLVKLIPKKKLEKQHN